MLGTRAIAILDVPETEAAAAPVDPVQPGQVLTDEFENPLTDEFGNPLTT